MRLLEKAKACNMKRPRSFLPGEQDIELSLAWVRGEVTMTQVAVAWGCVTRQKAIAPTVYRRLAECLRSALLAEEGGS